VAAASTAALLALLAAAPRFVPANGVAEARLAWLHDLTGTTGRPDLSGGALSWDPEARELFVARGDDLRVFNEAGLETHRFTDLASLGRLSHALPLAQGDLLLHLQREGGPALVRCDFRGRPKGEFRLTGLPPDLAGFTFQAIRRTGDRLWFLDTGGWRVLTTTLDGAFLDLRDFHHQLDGQGLSEADRELRGFWVDAKGSFYLGFPLIFHVAVVGPGGAMRGFGQKGSAAGKLNVIAGVAVDEDGFVYVADILKGAVLAYDPRFRFVGQVVGLTLPAEVFAAGGRLYIGQGGKAGVAVFQIRGK